jgi:N-acetylglucosamine kinase-like BadF-type ATPase
MNDLLEELKSLIIGVDGGGTNVSVLAYADDLVMLSDEAYINYRM